MFKLVKVVRTTPILNITSLIYRTRYLCAEQRGPIDGATAGDC
jgi:hypothetical protein